MRLTVEQEHRIGADYGQQDAIGLPTPQQLWGSGEYFFDRVRMGHHHPGPLTGQSESKRVAEASRRTLHEPPRVGHPRRSLNADRESGARQVSHGA